MGWPKQGYFHMLPYSLQGLARSKEGLLPPGGWQPCRKLSTNRTSRTPAGFNPPGTLGSAQAGQLSTGAWKESQPSLLAVLGI